MVLAAVTNELLKEQRTAAILLVWFVVGAAVVVLLWPKGRGRRLARQVFALAALGFREGLRLRMLWTVAVLSVIPVLLAYFSDADGTHAGRARLILNVCLACGELLGAALIVLLASLSVAREIESRIMHTLGAKPLPRWGILLGKALGFWAIDLLFVAGLLLFSALLVRLVPLRPETRPPEVLTPSGTWNDLRRNALTTRNFSWPENVTEEKFILMEPGETYQQRYAVTPPENGEDLALRLYFGSNLFLNTQINNFGVKMGYEGEKSFYDRLLDVPQDRPFDIFFSSKEVSRPGRLILTLTSPSSKLPQVRIFEPHGMILGAVADGFCSNLFKAFLLLALQGWLLALVITGWSGVLSFPVAAALGLLLVLGGEMSRNAVELMNTEFKNSRQAMTMTPETDSERSFNDTVTHALTSVLEIFPDFHVAGGPAAFVEGSVLSGWAIVHAFFWIGVVRCLGLALPGALLFQSREVGK